jgi:hypothetical protein
VTPAAAARARAGVAAPLRQPIAPRRVSGPTRHPRAAPLSPARQRHPLVLLLDAPFLDRLIRGRAWIALIAFALLGIVAMQVAILRLGASIGRSVGQIEQLSQQNETAATTIAGLQPGQNVGAEATALGMVYPPDDNIDYLRYNAGDAALAAASVGPPTVPLLVSPSSTLTAPLTASSTPVTPAASTASATQSTASPSSTTSATSPSTSLSTTSVPTSQGAASVPADGSASGAVSVQGGSSAPGAGAAG